MDPLAKALAREARRKGICDEWHRDLMVLNDKDDMLDMYIRGIDFCLSNDYPDNDFIRAHFKGTMETHGIYLDDRVNLTNPERCVALGDTHGSIHVSGYAVTEVFAKHDARLSVTADDHAFVMVDVFDRSEVTVSARDAAKICVNRYGGARVTIASGSTGQIKVIEKHKETY